MCSTQTETRPIPKRGIIHNSQSSSAVTAMSAMVRMLYAVVITSWDSSQISFSWDFPSMFLVSLKNYA